jgi:hypothetical protein
MPASLTSGTSSSSSSSLVAASSLFPIALLFFVLFWAPAFSSLVGRCLTRPSGSSESSKKRKYVHQYIEEQQLAANI